MQFDIEAQDDLDKVQCCQCDNAYTFADVREFSRKASLRALRDNPDSSQPSMQPVLVNA
jgi:hypothetical protein